MLSVHIFDLSISRLYHIFLLIFQVLQTKTFLLEIDINRLISWKIFCSLDLMRTFHYWVSAFFKINNMENFEHLSIFFKYRMILVWAENFFFFLNTLFNRTKKPISGFKPTNAHVQEKQVLQTLIWQGFCNQWAAMKIGVKFVSVLQKHLNKDEQCKTHQTSFWGMWNKEELHVYLNY